MKCSLVLEKRTHDWHVSVKSRDDVYGTGETIEEAATACRENAFFRGVETRDILEYYVGPFQEPGVVLAQ